MVLQELQIVKKNGGCSLDGFSLWEVWKQWKILTDLEPTLVGMDPSI